VNGTRRRRGPAEGSNYWRSSDSGRSSVAAPPDADGVGRRGSRTPMSGGGFRNPRNLNVRSHRLGFGVSMTSLYAAGDGKEAQGIGAPTRARAVPPALPFRRAPFIGRAAGPVTFRREAPPSAMSPCNWRDTASRQFAILRHSTSGRDTVRHANWGQVCPEFVHDQSLSSPVIRAGVGQASAVIREAAREHPRRGGLRGDCADPALGSVG
jgi:hypothetical protein